MRRSVARAGTTKSAHPLANEVLAKVALSSFSIAQVEYWPCFSLNLMSNLWFMLINIALSLNNYTISEVMTLTP